MRFRGDCCLKCKVDIKAMCGSLSSVAPGSLGSTALGAGGEGDGEGDGEDDDDDDAGTLEEG